jgi:hypothetical protein
MTPEFESLSPSARAERYRTFAAETLKLAQEARGSELKATYLSLSTCWNNLADKAEHGTWAEYPEDFAHCDPDA